MIFFLPFIVSAQIEKKDSISVLRRNSVYGEIGGQGITYSISYDRLFNVKRRVKTSITVGLNFFGTFKTRDYSMYIGFPVSYNFLFGKKNNHLELGLGVTILNNIYSYNYEIVTQTNGYSQSFFFRATPTDRYLYLTPKIGYRYQRPNGGFFFRVTLTPWISIVNSYEEIKNNGKIYKEKVYATFDGVGDFYGSPAFPWLGLSLGYTFKK